MRLEGTAQSSPLRPLDEMGTVRQTVFALQKASRPWKLLCAGARHCIRVGLEAALRSSLRLTTCCNIAPLQEQGLECNMRCQHVAGSSSS